MRPSLLALVLLVLALAGAGVGLHMDETRQEQQIGPPAPLHPVPTAAQLEWQQRELAMFLHFGVNTFTGREWGDGTEGPAIFNPSDLDARQWAQVARECGFGLMILTAKHHDGFCLWASAQTDHSVASSPWRDGKGDLVREFVDAARAEGLEVGLYLSPWDRNAAVYGDSPKYNDFYIAQLQELLTGYGPIAEVWFDGACGEGPNGRKQEYDWERFLRVVRELQPEAVMFSDAGPDVRWVGNERGVAGDPSWSRVDPGVVSYPGQSGEHIIRHLQHGERDGTVWRPAETDVSIRPGWFWRKSENEKVRNAQNLVELYFLSVGRNSLLLLNVPPDTRGQLHEADVAALRGFRKRLDEIFAVNLAQGATAKAQNVRGGAETFAAVRALDGDPQTYWATDDGVTTGWLEIDLGEPRQFNVISISEHIALGQRVCRFRVEYDDGDAWKPLFSAETIGYKRLARVPETRAQRVRLVIEESLACPTISEFALYLDPGAPAPPAH